MPIYEFLCKDCGHVFDELVKDRDKKVACPHCETDRTEKLISAHGGYNMASGGSSTRPRQAGAFRGKVSK